MQHVEWYDNWFTWLLAVIATSVTVILVAGFIWWRKTAGRRHMLRTLRNIADRLLRDVVIPDGVGGHVAIDALVLRDGRLYVLDIRDMEGAVFAGEKMDQWTAMNRRRRFSFHNPLRPMQDRAMTLRALAPELPVMWRILFTSRGHFPKGRPKGVELLDEFAQPLLRHRKAEPAVLDARLEEIWRRLCAAADVPVGRETPTLNAGGTDAAGT